jgi:hypothetical protein
MSDDQDQCDTYWRQLLGQAQVSLTGVSKPGLQAQLFDVLTDFFYGSNCWQEAIQVNVIPETLEYSVIPVQGGRILRLLAVLDQFAQPQAAFMPEIGTVRYQYPYNDVQTHAALVIKTVTDPQKCSPPDVPEWLLPKHHITLLNGLLGNMMMQPGASYSSPQLANFHLMKFRDGIAGARVAQMKANAIGAQAWAYPQQFRTVSQRGGVSTFNLHPAVIPRF